MKHAILLASCAAVFVFACDKDTVAPPTTGSLTLRIVTDEPVRAVTASATGLAATAVEESEPIARAGGTSSEPSSPTPLRPSVAGHLDAARVLISGPTPRTLDVTLAPSTTRFGATVQGLVPGLYGVVVEGFVSNEVDYFGQTSDLQVTAGKNTSAAMAFNSFRPVVADLGPPTAEMTFPVRWTRVASAQSYRVEWDKNPSFPSPASAAVTDTFRNITVSDTGTYNVRVRAANAWEPSGGRASDSKAINVAAASGSQSTLEATPTSIQASSGTIASTITVTVRDAGGTPLRGAAVRLDVSPTTGNALTQPMGTTNASGQIAGTLSSTKAGPKTVTATVGGIPITQSASVSVNAGAAAQVAITTQPSGTAQNGVPFAQQPVLQLQDAYGNAVDQPGVVVTATPASGPAGATLSNASATTGANGDATFSALTLSGPAGSYTLSLGASGLTAATSSAIILTAGPPSQVAITTQPSGTAQSGVSFARQPVLQLQDANGNAVNQSGVVVTATVLSGPAGATLSNASTTTGANGVATFSALTLSGTAGSYTLSFGAPGLTTVTSSPITLTAGPASQLAITTQPSGTAQSGVPFAQQPVLQLQDANGNPVNEPGVVVTATPASGPAGATLSNASATTGANGDATFSALTLSGTAGSYTLSLGASGLTAVTSNPITLTAGPASRLIFTGQPTTRQAGETITPPVEVTAQDAAGNTTTGFTGDVTLAITQPGGASLSGTTTVAAVAGAATFSDLRIYEAGTGYTLTPTATGLTGAASAAFDIINPIPALSMLEPDRATAGASGAVLFVRGSNFVGAPGTGIAYSVVRWNGTDRPTAFVDATLLLIDIPASDLDTAGTAQITVFNRSPGGGSSNALPFTINIRFMSVSAGGPFTCGVAADSSAYCWGFNASGELGNGTKISSNRPVLVLGGHQFTSLSSGDQHACGLDKTLAIYCWGDGSYGQLGDGGGNEFGETLPVLVLGGHSWLSVSAGPTHTCGVTGGHSGYCWGRGAEGQLGNGSTALSSTPVEVSYPAFGYESITAGGSHSCGVTTAGDAYCWGANSFGQLGNGSTSLGDSNPVLVSGGHQFQSISAGFNHTCAVTTNGDAYCWGDNTLGQLGDGSTASDSNPVLVSGGHSFRSLSAGMGYTCGVTTGGSGLCWGDNGAGQLGNGTVVSSPTPVSPTYDLPFLTMTAGGSHTCGVVTSGAAYCWGGNGSGELGNGSSTSSRVPVAVSPP